MSHHPLSVLQKISNESFNGYKALHYNFKPTEKGYLNISVGDDLSVHIGNECQSLIKKGPKLNTRQKEIGNLCALPSADEYLSEKSF